MRQLTRRTALILIFTLAITWIPHYKTTSAELSFPGIASQAAVLMEFSRGEIIFSQNGALRMPPASLTKIMTLLLAYEALEEGRVTLEDEVTVSEKAWGTGGSQMYLEISQKVAYGDLLKGIAIVSANDACVAISEYLYGLEANFVQEMNKKALQLSLLNTKFENASGLPHPDHYSSAEDIAVITAYLLKKFPLVLELYSEKEFTFNNITQINRNPLLDRFPGADGLKTGHTREAGYCLAGTAEQNGIRFITVVFNAPSETTRRADSEAMLNFAFRNYSLETIFFAGEAVSAIEVAKGDKKEVIMRAAEDIQVVIPYNRKEDLEISIVSQEYITSPVVKGTPVGTLEISIDGTVILEEPLLAAEDVPKAGYITLLLRSVKDFVTSFWQKAINKIADFRKD